MCLLVDLVFVSHTSALTAMHRLRRYFEVRSDETLPARVLFEISAAGRWDRELIREIGQTFMGAELKRASEAAVFIAAEIGDSALVRETLESNDFKYFKPRSSQVDALKSYWKSFRESLRPKTAGLTPATSAGSSGLKTDDVYLALPDLFVTANTSATPAVASMPQDQKCTADVKTGCTSAGSSASEAPAASDLKSAAAKAPDVSSAKPPASTATAAASTPTAAKEAVPGPKSEADHKPHVVDDNELEATASKHAFYMNKLPVSLSVFYVPPVAHGGASDSTVNQPGVRLVEDEYFRPLGEMFSGDAWMQIDRLPIAPIAYGVRGEFRFRYNKRVYQVTHDVSYALLGKKIVVDGVVWKIGPKGDVSATSRIDNAVHLKQT